MKKLSDFAADSQKDYYLDKDKSLNEQNISDECKNLLALIYYTYVLDSNEKNVMLDTWLKNECNSDNNVF